MTHEPRQPLARYAPAGRLRSLVALTAIWSQVALVPVAAAALRTPALAAQQTARVQPRPDFTRFDRYVAQAVRDWKVPGLAIAVVKDDSLVFAKGYGVIEMGKPAPVTIDTRFAIGSTTKAMTVAALGMLVDEGKLHWDDRVIDHLPDFQLSDAYVTRELTIRDLLTHRTGLPGTDLLWVFNSYPTADVIRRLRYVKPESSFRSQWDYQNIMFAVAGAIVEQASGMSWADFVRSRIFAPLGMTETIPTVAGIMGQPNVAVPHGEVHDTVRVVPIRTTDAIAPAGSVWSSVRDMSRWMRFMLDSGRVDTTRLLKPATFREIVAPEMRVPLDLYPALSLSRPHVFMYALGWLVQDYHGQIIWMHTGSIDGMSALIALLPDQRAGVYVLANLDHAELRHALMYRVLDLYEGNAPRDWSADMHKLYGGLEQQERAAKRDRATRRASNTHPSLPLERYTGTYSDSTYGNVIVTLGDSTLQFSFAGGPVRPLEHWDYDRFRAHPDTPMDDDLFVTFAPDGAGHVSSARAFGVTFMRVPDKPATP